MKQKCIAKRNVSAPKKIDSYDKAMNFLQSAIQRWITTAQLFLLDTAKRIQPRHHYTYPSQSRAHIIEKELFDKVAFSPNSMKEERACT